MTLRSIGVLAVLLAFAFASCSSNNDRDGLISGVVIEVSGGISNVDAFVVLDSEGKSHLFFPEDGLLYYGGPLSHLRDHVVSGERVFVTYVVAEDGRLVAVTVEDADPFG